MAREFCGRIPGGEHAATGQTSGLFLLGLHPALDSGLDPGDGGHLTLSLSQFPTPMKMLRLLGSSLALAAATAAFAADPTGTWQWTTRSPNGEIETTLKLESKDGKLAGAYSNQFGDAMISNVSFQEDVLSFDVVRELGGGKFVVKYRGKLDGDTLKGTLEAASPDGGESMKLDWNAKRSPAKG
jgi:hypothetical protein